MSVEEKEDPENMLRSMSDVFLLVDKACLDSAGSLLGEEENRLAELNERIHFYHQCFKNCCEDQPSKKRHNNFTFDNLVPRFSQILRDFILTHQWPQALKWVHALSKEVQNTDSTLWKAGLACLIQNGSQHLIQSFLTQLQSVNGLTCVEVLLDYLLHLLTLGDLLAAKELIVDLKQSDKHSKNLLTNERRKEAHRLFYAYQGLVLYLEWKIMTMEENSDSSESDTNDIMTPSKSRKDDIISSKIIAQKAVEYLTSVKDLSGVWDIFLSKVVIIHEYYNDLDDARTLLKLYREVNPSNPNAHRNLFEFEKRHEGDKDLMLQCLQDVLKLDPSNSLAITLFKTLERTNPETVSVLFNYLDFHHCQNDSLAWKLFAEHLIQIHEDCNKSLVEMVKQCWDVRKDWWPSFILMLECDDDQHIESTMYKDFHDTCSLTQCKQIVAGVLYEIEAERRRSSRQKDGLKLKVKGSKTTALSKSD